MQNAGPANKTLRGYRDRGIKTCSSAQQEQGSLCPFSQSLFSLSLTEHCVNSSSDKANTSYTKLPRQLSVILQLSPQNVKAFFLKFLPAQTMRNIIYLLTGTYEKIFLSNLLIFFSAARRTCERLLLFSDFHMRFFYRMHSGRHNGHHTLCDSKTRQILLVSRCFFQCSGHESSLSPCRRIRVLAVWYPGARACGPVSRKPPLQRGTLLGGRFLRWYRFSCL